jgi:3'-5' exoribonuclease
MTPDARDLGCMKREPSVTGSMVDRKMTEFQMSSLFPQNGDGFAAIRDDHQPAAGDPPQQPKDSQAPAKLFVRDLSDGQAIDTIFLVRERSLRKRRNGDDYLRLVLADTSGTLAAVCWDGAIALNDVAEPGAAVRVQGRYGISDRYGPQLTVESLVTVREGDYRPDDLLAGPMFEIAQMEADLRELVGTIQNPHLRRLLESLLGEHSDVWRRFRAAPAAKYYHQAYGHGLLEHTLLVAQSVSAISASFPGVDRDLAVTGALLHDIGKIEAYGSNPAAIDLTDDGKLLGEIPLGYYLVRRETERIEGFPWPVARALLHIILAHHGTHENGSPVVPATREATIVHALDNLGGKLGCFDRLQKELSDGQTWSPFDRALSGAAYFAARPAA